MTTTTRTHQSFPETKITTQYGPLTVVGNGEQSLCIRTDSRPGSHELIEVRGVTYSINAHVTREGDDWKVSGSNSYEQRQYVHISRVDWKNHGEATEAARKTITALVLDVAKQYGTADLNRGGRLANINNALMTLEREIREMQEQIDAKNAEAARLRAEEALILTENE